MLFRIFSAALLFTSLAFNLSAMPAQVFIIRHAEKPPEGNGLSLKGKERAAALVPYFMETKELIIHGTPVAIYAMAAPKEDSSVRPIDTVKKLADELKITVNTNYVRDNYKKMVDDIKSNAAYSGKTVLISWEHDVIPDIARSFGALQAPYRWQSDVFDRVWMITFEVPTGRAVFQNIPQRLMFGDSNF
jgi:hypothetical protein